MYIYFTNVLVTEVKYTLASSTQEVTAVELAIIASNKHHKVFALGAIAKQFKNVNLRPGQLCSFQTSPEFHGDRFFICKTLFYEYLPKAIAERLEKRLSANTSADSLPFTAKKLLITKKFMRGSKLAELSYRYNTTVYRVRAWISEVISILIGGTRYHLANTRRLYGKHIMALVDVVLNHTSIFHLDKDIAFMPEDPEDRLIGESFDNDGDLVQRSVGPNGKERQILHDNHMCGAFCGICYHEAMKSIGLE